MLGKIGGSLKALTGSKKKLDNRGTGKLDTATSVVPGSASPARSPAAASRKSQGSAEKGGSTGAGAAVRGQPKASDEEPEELVTGEGDEPADVLKIGQDEPQAPPQPAIFVSMGAPSLLIETSEGHAFFRELGMKYNYPERKPSCVICVSARWVSDGENNVKIMSNPKPRTAHDFSAFAECLYEVQYMANGSPDCAAKIAEALTAGGIEWEFDGLRAFDFGCWSPLALIFPDASVPVVQVSLHSSLANETHVALGEALAPLKDEGYLLVCSGNITHNLLELSFGEDRPPAWAMAFDGWVSDVLEHEEHKDTFVTSQDAWNSRNRRLANWNDISENIVASANAAHPNPQNFLPLLVAAGSGGGCKQLHQSWAYGCMSMASYMFGELPPRKGQAEQDDVPEDEEEGGSTRPATGGFVTLASMKATMRTADQSQESDESAVKPSTKPSRPKSKDSQRSSRPPSRDLVNRAKAATHMDPEHRFADQLSQLSAHEGLNRGAPEDTG